MLQSAHIILYLKKTLFKKYSVITIIDIMDMKLYKQKYLKYKDKYIKLKLNGGNGTRDKFLPCEIIFNTQLLYMNKNVSVMINQLLKQYQINIPFNLSGREQYQQDPSILLKQFNLDNYGIVVKPGLNLSDIVTQNIPAFNSNDYGGNFISSPPSFYHPNGIVLYFNQIGKDLETYLQENLIQKIVGLSCSFRNMNERHIDECMCFMPYKESYKIWIYKIRNIVQSEELIKRFEICDLSFVIPKLQKLLVSEYISNEIKESVSILLDSKASLEAKLIATTNKQLYKKLTGQEFDCLKYHYNKDIKLESVRDIVQFRQMLEEERLRNLNIISMELFNSPYESNKSIFVEFPIDIEIDNINNFNIINIPIFNRLWIETPEISLALFSTDSTYDPDVKAILDIELTLIKSVIGNTKPFYYNNVNTSNFHNNGRVGGNLHCLVKNRY